MLLVEKSVVHMAHIGVKPRTTVAVTNKEKTRNFRHQQNNIQHFY